MLKNLGRELETGTADRRFGRGWISGAAALLCGIIGLVAVLCLRFPELLTMADARKIYNVALVRSALHVVLIAGFVLAVVSIMLRQRKVLGLSAMVLILTATLLGGSQAQTAAEIHSDVYFGLDWFVLNLLFTGMLFIPIERWFGRLPDQPVFRQEWREDLFYFFISSLLVQSLTYLSLLPAQTVIQHTTWSGLRAWVSAQPVWLQFIEIMFLTDLVQYWVHRTFHRVPALWRFHAVHHSARAMDWLAGSRMHFVEIVCLRGLTVIPMYCLGFSNTAMYAYIGLVYVHATFVHANLRFDFGWLKRILVTPQFHHWHHGIEKEAIDVNFAVHFPLLDRLFGTHYLPGDKWPSAYGIGGHPVPAGFLRQFAYPFQR